MALSNTGVDRFLAQNYYSKTQLNSGQLDTRYFAESEFLNTSAGAGDAGKPVKLDASGLIASSMLSGGTVATHAALTAAHGATGAVVGTTNTQTLTNKTLTTPTISGTGFANANHAHTGSTSGGQLDHGAALTGLSDDDHTQYALSAGRSGGQSLIGGTASGNNLTLRSSSNATKGKVIFGNAGTTAYDEVNERFGVGTASPTTTMHVKGDLRIQNTPTGNSNLFIGESEWRLLLEHASGARRLHIYDDVNAVRVMTYDYNGKVGIKNSAPSTELDVTGTATVTTLAATNATVGGVAVTTATNTQTLTNKTLTSPTINTPTIGTSAVVPLIYGGTAANDDITIHGTSNATKTTSYVLLNPSSGGVGVGTTDPGAGNFTVGDSGGDKLFIFDPDGGTGSTPKLTAYTVGGATTTALEIASSTLTLNPGTKGLIFSAQTTPASASDTGSAGAFCWDTSYLYICTAANTWRRVAHATW